MSIWRVAPAQEHPEAELRSWRVYELEDGDRHFCGYETYLREGRVCSRVVSFDPESRQGITKSGRSYELKGPPGYDSDAMYVWDRWCQINNVEAYRDVSEEVYSTFSK